MEREKEKKKTTSEYKKPDNEPGINFKYRISVLINSCYYFFDHVLIIENTDLGKFQLLISLNQNIVLRKNYASLRGAKIAFNKYFNNRCHQPGAEPDWTNFYYPEKIFIENLLSTAKNNQNKIHEV